jgi:hypothetical protein
VCSRYMKGGVSSRYMKGGVCSRYNRVVSVVGIVGWCVY